MKEQLAHIRHLQLNYGNVQAIKDVSFELYRGEILAIVGPNGSGKTSTVECLEGLRKPTGGEIKILGHTPHTSRRRIYKEIGIQLQDAAYPENIRVKELCRLFSSFYETPVDWKLLLEQLGLSVKSNRMVKKLSGGERQRLTILLALLGHPRILILDELTTGLDPEVRRGIWDSLQQIRTLGTTILLVSHDMNEVEYLADRLIYFEDGRSVFAGSQTEFRTYVKDNMPAETWNEPHSLEDVYLFIAPKTRTVKLEELL